MRDTAHGGIQVRVALRPHLRRLAAVPDEVRVEVTVEADGRVTLQAVLDALERRHPVLRGTIRGHGGADRRPLIGFFAGGLDLSHDGPDAALPEAVTEGEEPVHVVGAIAGG